MSSPSLDPADLATFARAEARARVTMRAYAGILEQTRATFGIPWTREFVRLLRVRFPTDDDLDAAFRGYSRFVSDSLRLQAAYERSGRYRSSSYTEVAARVYHNPAYMMHEYLPGLLLSHYLWPHHVRQMQFFEQAFIPAVREAGAGCFAEVGVGTGLYSRRLLETDPMMTGVGYDISASSQEFTRHHLDVFDVGGRYALVLQDILMHPPSGRFPAVVCVEVLEHLEDPVALLRALRTMLAPGGRAFITAAVSADHADHIFLYRTAGEVEAHVEAAGFVIEQRHVASAHAPRYDDQPVPVAAAVIAR